MRTSEWLTLGYFAFLILVAAALLVPRARLWRVVLLAACSALPIAILASLHASRASSIARDWLPGLSLLCAYWATGATYRGPNRRMEAALARSDRRLFASLGPTIARVPRGLLEAVEFAYLLCYPMVPLGLAVLYMCGERARADAYWTLVLLPTFAAYAVLPLAGSRPPRTLGLDTWIDCRHVAIRRVNRAVLDRGSIGVNTCPSAHVTASMAAALFLVTTGWPGIPFLALAIGISVGAFLGRYHYAFDVGAGLLLAATAWLILI